MITFGTISNLSNTLKAYVLSYTGTRTLALILLSDFHPFTPSQYTRVLLFSVFIHFLTSIKVTFLGFVSLYESDTYILCFDR